MIVQRSCSVDQVLWFFTSNESLEAILIEEKIEKDRRLLGIVTRWDIANLQKK